MKWNTAATIGLDRLYHYQPFDPVRLSKIILEKALYFSNPGDFNDPWDCRPWWNVDALSDPVVFDRHIDWYITVTRKHGQNIPENEIQRRANVFRSNPELFIGKMKEISLAIEATINERYRVYCLSSKPGSELMWAHYSNKHQGICLEFDAGNELFSQALKLSYQEDYPLFDLTNETEDEQLMPLTTKSAAWNYEDEYRLIAQEENAAVPEDTLMTQSNYIELPDGALTAIIVGCTAPDSTLNAIKELIEQSTCSVKLKRAVRARDQYKLSIICI